MVRKIDRLGRIVLPVEIRKSMGLDADSIVELNFSGNAVVLKKASRQCRICGSSDDVRKEISLCASCISFVKNIE